MANDDLLNVIKNAIEKYGRETALSDPRRVSSFFADMARDVPKPQKIAFVKCLEHDFVQSLQNVSEASREDCKRKLAQRLHDEEGLDLRLCGEALDLLAEVLFSGQENTRAVPKEAYFIYRESGPYDASIIKEMIADGRITIDYYIRSNSGYAWKPVTSLFNFATSSVPGNTRHGMTLKPATTVATTFSKLRLLRTHSAGSGAFSPDSEYIVSGEKENTLKLWKTKNGQLIRTFKGHEDEVYAVAFSPDGKYIVSGARDKTLKIWEAENGRLIRTMRHEWGVSSVAFSPNGRRVVSGSYDETLKTWEPKSGRLIHTITGHKETVSSVVFSPDGRHIVSGSLDKTLKIWETESGRLIHTIKGCSLAFSPDGRYFVSGASCILNIWEAESRQLIRTFDGHKDSVNSVAFSPDGKHIVSGSLDKTLKIWETESGRLIHTIEGHKQGLHSIALSLDGKYIVSVTLDKTLRLWVLDDDGN